MKAAYLADVGKLEIKEVEKPFCPVDSILVRVKACAICGTDLKVYRYGHRLIKFPRITGHELAGEIVEIGPEIKSYKLGDRVTVAPAIPCGECFPCRCGIQGMCDNLIAIGYHCDGGFAEYMAVPARAVKTGCVNIIPDNVTFDEAALTEPLAVTINCQEISPVGLGDAVVVVGGGPLGCFHADLAKSKGAAKVIMVEVSPKRLKQARISGADIFVNSAEENPVDRVLKETNNKGADIVIVACSSGVAQEDALQMVCKRGHVNFFGSLPKDNSVIRLDSNIVHYKECFISGTHGSTPQQNQLALSLLSGGNISLKKYVTHHLSLDDLRKGLEIVEKGEGLKVIINP